MDTGWRSDLSGKMLQLLRNLIVDSPAIPYWPYVCREAVIGTLYFCLLHAVIEMVEAFLKEEDPPVSSCRRGYQTT